MFKTVLILLAIGVLLGLMNKYVDMDKTIKTIINVFVIVCVVFWLLSAFGPLSGADIPVPRVH